MTAIKNYTTTIAAELKRETETIYGKLSDGSEQGLNAVWELCHQMAGMIGRFRIGDLQKMLVLMDQLREMPEDGAGELLAVVAAFRSGEGSGAGKQESPPPEGAGFRLMCKGKRIGLPPDSYNGKGKR